MAIRVKNPANKRFTESRQAIKNGVADRINPLSSCTKRFVWVNAYIRKLAVPLMAARRRMRKNFPSFRRFTNVRWGRASVHHSDGAMISVNFPCICLAMSLNDNGSSINELLEESFSGNFPQCGHLWDDFSFPETFLKTFPSNWGMCNYFIILKLKYIPQDFKTNFQIWRSETRRLDEKPIVTKYLSIFAPIHK